MSSPRPVIFTAAVNYDRAGLEPFVNSWKKHVPEAELVVFAGNLSNATLQWLEASGATVLIAGLNVYNGGSGPSMALFNKSTEWGVRLLDRVLRLTSRGRDDRGKRLRETATHLAMQRYFLALRHLQAFGHKYSDVLLIDCRDAVFQRSPFPCTGLHTYAENETIGHSHFAKRWYQLTYGHKEWKREAALPFLCSGVTLGDRASILVYLECMCAEALRIVPCVAGLDQAVHNYIVHNQLVPATIHAFGHGEVINLNATPLASLDVRDGRMYNRDGELLAIVHQYDRVPGLKLAP